MLLPKLFYVGRHCLKIQAKTLLYFHVLKSSMRFFSHWIGSTDHSGAGPFYGFA